MIRKAIMTIADDGRRAYETPTMDVHQLTTGQPLLVVSGEQQTMDIILEEEEEWPVDPDTNQPFLPW